jgi:hypothetical protein
MGVLQIRGTGRGHVTRGHGPYPVIVASLHRHSRHIPENTVEPSACCNSFHITKLQAIPLGKLAMLGGESGDSPAGEG